MHIIRNRYFYDKLNNAMYLNKIFTANMALNQIRPDLYQQISLVIFGHLLIEFEQTDGK